jgi:hypothetical protein
MYRRCTTQQLEIFHKPAKFARTGQIMGNNSRTKGERQFRVFRLRSRLGLSIVEWLTMVISSLPHLNLQEELERQVSQRTGRRVRNLAVELEPERIILRGLATTYHVKQLAQHGVRELMPNVRLDNVIVVTSDEAV